MEDKKLIVEKLFELLKMTRAGSGLVSMDYLPGETELVELVYKQGKTLVNVTADSGAALIRDVLKKV